MSWAHLEAAAGATIDAVLEESFTIRQAAPPPADVNARRIVSGAPVNFSGVWSEEHVQRFPDGRGHASTDSREFGAGMVSVDYPTAALPFAAKIGDIVIRLATGRRYAVADPGGNGFTRTRLVLSSAR